MTEKSVEAIAKIISENAATPYQGANLIRKLSVLKLKLISDEEKMACSSISKYPFTEVMDVIDEACQHQLEKDQQTLEKG